ncbi:hypothetical protein Tco_1145418 [Tanacetum coccineum]
MCTYLKNMEGYKLKDLKFKEFDSIQEMFDRAFKRQKVEDNKETTMLKQCLEITPDEEEVTSDVIPLAAKSPKSLKEFSLILVLDQLLVSFLGRECFGFKNSSGDGWSICCDCWCNSKFVNNMLPEWGRFVIAVKLNRGLKTSNYDQLYAYLKQHEAHANENKMMLERYNQYAIDPLAFVSNVSPPQYNTQSSAIPQSAYVPPVTHQP